MDLNFVDNSFILKYHLDKIRNKGINTPGAVGWRSREGQLARFEAITGIGDMTGCTVLDVGCGTGDLLSCLDAKYAGIQYTGIDIMEPFLQWAAECYHDRPTTTFLHGDISDAALPAADYVLACGTLSYRHSEEGYLFRVIRKLYDTAHHAFAFNLLTSIAEPTPLLCTYEPGPIMNYCRTLSDDVTLFDQYLDGDFMIRLAKQR